MKRLTYIIAIIALGLTNAAMAQQQPTVIELSQVEGKFSQTELILEPGTYVFEVTNASVDREVGLVVANTTDDGTTGDHIKEGYLSNTITKGQTAKSQVVTLEAGTYKYFCPLNPTPEYTITVSE
ncbi:MAG: cupredoxin domain-containing protein [Bacteroidota bacterium]